MLRSTALLLTSSSACWCLCFLWLVRFDLFTATCAVVENAFFNHNPQEMTNKRPITITHFETHGELALLCVHTSTANLPCLPALADVRFPTSLTGDGTDAMYAGITAQCNDMTTYPTPTGTQIVTILLHMSFYIPLRRSSRAMA